MPTVWARLQSVGRSDWYVEFPASFATAPRPITIGRNPASTLCLTDNMTISNRHITLEQRILESEGRRTVVMHESSSNGTLVNGIQYQKGQSVELANGTEIIFPCEDLKNDKKLDYTFVFHVLLDEMESNGRPLVGNANAPSDDWQVLQSQCDELAHVAARLAASVYSNSSKVTELATTLKNDESSFHDPLGEAAQEMLQLLRAAESRLRELGDGDTASKINSSKWEMTLGRLGVATSKPANNEPI